MSEAAKTLLGAVTAALLLVGLSSARAQQGLGAKYHTRDPRTCASMADPRSGPPSAAQAGEYLMCSLEREYSPHLYLLSDVRVEVGKGTPLLELSRSSRPYDGDVDGIVYSIRGSYKQYQCSSSTNIPNGQQCTRYDHPRAEGTCYRNNFGDWYCNMRDGSVVSGIPDQPPPG